MKLPILLLLLFFSLFSGWSQSLHSFFRDGDMAYENGNFQDAELFYRKSF